MKTAYSLASLLLIPLLAFAAFAGDHPFEVVAELDEPPGNITVTPDGRIIFSMSQAFQTDLRVGELVDGAIVPFPNEEWSLGGYREDRVSLDTVLGLQSDPLGIVWMLDNAARGGSTPKLVGWDTRADELHKVIYVTGPALIEGSFLNDLAVDRTRNKIYISDTAGARGALIVTCIETGASRRVLEGHVSMVPEDVDLMIASDRPAQRRQPDGTLAKPRIAVNGLALDVKNEWLYYGPLNGLTMYRVRVDDLVDESLSESQRAARVEAYSEKTISDGMGVDWEGNIYVTAVSDDHVGVITPDREYNVLFSDPVITRWPDGMSYGPDGYMYIIANQLYLTPGMTGGEMEAEPPFYIIRFPALAPGVIGR